MLVSADMNQIPIDILYEYLSISISVFMWKYLFELHKYIELFCIALGLVSKLLAYVLIRLFLKTTRNFSNIVCL